jgi:uncharacterized protein with PQ loop repeat
MNCYKKFNKNAKKISIIRFFLIKKVEIFIYLWYDIDVANIQRLIVYALQKIESTAVPIF